MKKRGGEGLTASVLQANDHCNDGTVVCFNLSVCGWSERCVHISVANLANFLPNVLRVMCKHTIVGLEKIQYFSGNPGERDGIHMYTETVCTCS